MSGTRRSDRSVRRAVSGSGYWVVSCQVRVVCQEGVDRGVYRGGGGGGGVEMEEGNAGEQEEGK